MPNPLKELSEHGQSIWLDYIRRDLLFNGELERSIEEDGLAGMTSNPTIFQGAISGSDLYDDDIRKAGRDATPVEVFERLAFADIQRAADLYRPLYDETEGRDGYVSIEVDPMLAYETDATTAEAKRVWETVDRPNIMIKIPGTYEGLPAVRASLAAGINVNITLLFSVETYHEVIDAWLSGLEDRHAQGLPIDRIASVASFFVSRVDSKTDKRLDEIERDASEEDLALSASLKGKAGIANARLAYEAFDQRCAEGRFAALADAGARVQRPLWASTSTKNPAYPDVYYVESLIAPDSVNTLPPQTLEAYRDHGEPKVRIYDNRDGAHAIMDGLKKLGINFGEVTSELEKEGVKAFADSYKGLLETIAEEQRLVQPA